MVAAVNDVFSPTGDDVVGGIDVSGALFMFDGCDDAASESDMFC
jgi:hypothetical protein